MRKPYGDAKESRLLVLDLDGTIRKGKDELGHFVNGPDDVVVFPGVGDILREFQNSGWRVAVATNQGGIAMGYMTNEDFLKSFVETEQRMKGEQGERLIDQLSWCQHHPDADSERFRNCWCRKPKVGMVASVSTSLRYVYGEYYPPYNNIFVGDRPEDRECAERAGMEFIEAERWRQQGFDVVSTEDKYLQDFPKLSQVDVDLNGDFGSKEKTFIMNLIHSNLFHEASRELFERMIEDLREFYEHDRVDIQLINDQRFDIYVDKKSAIVEW